MDKLLLIIKREFIARVRNKTFVVMTFASPLIMVAMFLIIAWLSTLNNDHIHTIAIHDESGDFVPEFQDNERLHFTDLSVLPFSVAKDSVIMASFYGLLYIPKQSPNMDQSARIKLYADEVPSFDVIQKIENVIGNKLTNEKLLRKGLDLNEISQAKTRIDLKIENFSGEKRSKMSNFIKMIFGGATGYLLMMFIVIYGNMIMRSVIEEKTNRIIEIIISSVRPIQLLFGKILGTSLAGLTQFGIWIVLGGVLLLVISNIFGITSSGINASQVALPITPGNLQELELIRNDVFKLPLTTLFISFFIYFFGGYFLYSSLYAAIGAAVDSETDTQQFMLPILFPLMLGIYIGFFVVMENPHGTISVIFSMLPFTAPVVMLMRIPFGVPWWQIMISVVILLVTIVLTVWLAAKIYRIGILMYGKKPTYRELLKWLKY